MIPLQYILKALTKNSSLWLRSQAKWTNFIGWILNLRNVWRVELDGSWSLLNNKSISIMRGQWNIFTKKCKQFFSYICTSWQIDYMLTLQPHLHLASHADINRASSHIPSPQTFVEKDCRMSQKNITQQSFIMLLNVIWSKLTSLTMLGVARCF